MKEKFLLLILILTFSLSVRVQNYSSALVKKAEQGDAVSQGKFGLCYFLGDGVQQNYEKAVEWFLKGAENGNRLYFQ